MNNLSVEIKILIDFSEGTKSFISSLLNGATPTTKAPSTNQPVEQKPPAQQQKPQPTQTATKQVEKPAEKPAEKPVEKQVAKKSATTESTSSEVTVVELRKLLAPKVDANREVIRQKLDEFGAKSMTTLDPQYYVQMRDFLISL